jgi:hypothetical protein
MQWLSGNEIVERQPEGLASLRILRTAICFGLKVGWKADGKTKRAADNPLCAGRPKILNFSPVVEDKQI